MSLGDFPILAPKLILGLETRIINNIHFLSDEEVVYPVGSVVVVHNFQLKKQRFIKLSERGKNLTHLAVSPNKKLIAVVESTDKLPIVTLWCPVQFRKKRTILLPQDKEIYANRYVTLDFSFDSKYLMCVTGEPDWMMYCFRCDKGRLESSCKAINTNGVGTVHKMACNPNDQNQVIIVGESVLRSLGCQNFSWRLFGYNKQDSVIYTSCTWLSQDRAIVGSDKGRILIMETGELKAVFTATDMPIINMTPSDENFHQESPNVFRNRESETSQTSIESTESIKIIEGDSENYEIRCLTCFNRGFVFGFTNGVVHLYEKETAHKYIKRGVFIIPNRLIPREYDEEPEILTGVNTIAINPSQDRVLVSCRDMQLWYSRIFIHDATTGPEVTFREFGYPMHLGPVGSLAVCRWKPIVITAGERDRSLKIWNYETDEVELIRHFEDDIYSVALHPSGLYAAIGFSDKLRFMAITIDDIATVKEFNIRTCRMVSFSRLGHFFAAANGNVIEVYSSITFVQMYVLKGHSGKITGMSWSYDDRTLATCGTEGTVYGWKVQKAARINETILKSTQFTGVAINREGKNMFCVGTDGHLRELLNANIHRDVVIAGHGIRLDDVILSMLDTMLFVSGNDGVIYVVKLPFFEKAECVEYIMQNTRITKICLSWDDRFMISVAVDGTICFWKLLNIEDKTLMVDPNAAKFSEVLIARTVLEDKLEQINTLHLRMREFEAEHTYQMRQKDTLYQQQIKDIHTTYCAAIEDLKIKNEQMETDHIQEINNINQEIQKMKIDHEMYVQKLEDHYNEKLIMEYEKFHAYEAKMEKLLRASEERYEQLKKDKAASEEAITNDFMEQLREKDYTYEELLEHSEQEQKKHEVIKQQIEDDADREIYELKEAHEKELKEEQDLNVRVRGEAAAMKKKYLAAQKETDDLKHRVFCMENEHVKFKGIIQNLEKEIMDAKKEIEERDQTIEDKEKRLFQLKRKNQELEKFKFILDFKIKELKSQIEPKEKTIQEQVHQINDMVRELENLQKVILGLDLQLTELREKLGASNNEVKKEIAKNRRMKHALQAIRIDIHNASSVIQNVSLLQKTVKDMYHKYNADKDFEITQAEDTEAKNEFLRQREFLERTVATLHSQATKNANALSYDKVRLVEENASLLVETNSLRKHLQAESSQTKKLNALIGLSYISPKLAQRKVNMAAATNLEIHNKYKERLEENEKAIQMLKEENERLVNKIAEINQALKSPEIELCEEDQECA
ncbi:hypothetical protein NQ317_005638 [Molorchus minor]|uniref:Cilia- and flagella-associated protein 57 n=1 Tax=Molorchus minor TaxID=1323400 RepID=A0ABQ9K771_9CUCU|nr:hypothetical protein NQ317_005638 [Molorchus minor]